jgi:FixJ family two-component response regulator
VLGTVHIVDDDASFLAAMARRLKVARYEVLTYPSALQLLNKLPDESGPGCILLDVKIPGVSGPDLQDRLGELGSTLPIVFLTGHADVPTTVRAIKAGADNFLMKPISSEQLLQAIEQAMARHSASRGQRQIWMHFASCSRASHRASGKSSISLCKASSTSTSPTNSAPPNAPSRLIVSE